MKDELAKAQKEGFVTKFSSDSVPSKKKTLAVVGIVTGFGRRKNRDAIRKAWMPTGTTFTFEYFLLNSSDSTGNDYLYTFT